MREIKFRGKCLISGDWVYGDLIHGVGARSGKIFILPTKINLAYVNHCDPLDGVLVDPETVGQFIGLKDKNVKEIYEGDIVEGYMGWMKGDGRLKNGYPNKIRYWFEVIHSDGKFHECGWELKEISVHPEDDFARAEYFYRSILYRLYESRECELKNNEVQWKGICESIEVIGNVYEFKELTQENKKHNI